MTCGIVSRSFGAFFSRLRARLWFGGVHAASFVQARLAQSDISMSVLVPADFGFAGAKLSVYRSPTQWLIAIQRIGYNSESGECENWVEATAGFGPINQTVIVPIAIAETDRTPALTEQPDGTTICRLVGAPLWVNSVQLALPSTELVYLEHHIRGPDTPENEISRPVALLRYLAMAHREDLFMRDKTLLHLLSVDPKLELLYETYEWRHPVVAQGERASQSPFFMAIGRAIEANSTVELDALKRGANTSWRNWPEWPE